MTTPIKRDSFVPRKRVTPPAWRASIALICLTMAAAVGCEQSDSPASTEPPPVQTTAANIPASEPPTVSKIDAAGLEKQLLEHRGKLVVVNFWATWCPPCVAEMPALVSFYKDYKNSEDVVFISVSADFVDTALEVVPKFIKERGIPFDVFIIETDSPLDLQPVLQTDWEGALPATFLFDRVGKPVQSWFEEITRVELDAALAPLLKRAGE